MCKTGKPPPRQFIKSAQQKRANSSMTDCFALPEAGISYAKARDLVSGQRRWGNGRSKVREASARALEKPADDGGRSAPQLCNIQAGPLAGRELQNHKRTYALMPSMLNGCTRVRQAHTGRSVRGRGGAAASLASTAKRRRLKAAASATATASTLGQTELHFAA